VKNQIARHLRQLKADKYEKDRIGQGTAAELTRRFTGIDIGGPNKELREAIKNKNNKDS